MCMHLKPASHLSALPIKKKLSKNEIKKCYCLTQTTQQEKNAVKVGDVSIYKTTDIQLFNEYVDICSNLAISHIRMPIYFNSLFTF